MKLSKPAFLLLAIIFFLVSCGNDKAESTIPKDKLIKIFFDLHAAENIINRASANERDSLTMLYRDQIFKIYNVDKKEFEKKLKALQSNPEEFKNFYTELNKYGDQLLEKEKNKKPD
jgi:hypothetical protein